MKLSREKLLAYLSLVRPAVGSVGAVAELSHVWFSEGTLSAYNGGLGISVAAEEIALNCGLPGAILTSLLKSSTLKELELKQERGTLTAKLGRTSLKLATLDPERRIWPFDEEAVPPTQLAITEELLEALKRVAIIHAANPTNVVHYGVVVEPGEGGLELYTTDTQTLATVTVEMKIPKGLERTILPHPFVDALLSLCKAGTMLGIAENYLVASAKEIEVFSNALDVSSATDLPAVVEKHVPKKLAAATLPAPLKAALERAEIISGSKDALVTVSVDGDALELTAAYPMGSLEETFELDKPQKASAGCFAVRDLLRAVGKADAFTLTENVAIFTGKSGLLYLAATHAPEKKAGKRTRATRDQNSED